MSDRDDFHEALAHGNLVVVGGWNCDVDSIESFVESSGTFVTTKSGKTASLSCTAESFRDAYCEAKAYLAALTSGELEEEEPDPMETL